MFTVNCRSKFVRTVGVFLIAVVAAAPAMAGSIIPSEPWDGPATDLDELNLYEIYNAASSTSLTSNTELDAFWVDIDDVLALNNGTIWAFALAKFAELRPQTFGFWEGEVGTGTRVELFTLTDDALYNPWAPGNNVLAPVSGDFTLFDDVDGSVEWYSDDTKNTPVEKHLVAYSTPYYNTFMLGWEDTILGDGDQDFNDLVVLLHFPPVIPEPATLLIFGMGVAGVAAIRRRKS
jgi:PEP-CTERM motif-containing protein